MAITGQYTTLQEPTALYTVRMVPNLKQVMITEIKHKRRAEILQAKMSRGQSHEVQGGKKMLRPENDNREI